jgi:peptidoglycan/LPS O-acetylase OafA/YrhL
LNKIKIKYRPEVDGLRAIGAVPVAFYHADITYNSHNIMPGGFVSVDIFFVISGYLITLFLLKELFETKTIDFIGFYERRARRILPPLFFVLIVSSILGFFYLAPLALENLSKSIFYVIFFVSNYYFEINSLEYSAPTSLYLPMLHTWSLSIEEQFYIFFPIILLILFKFRENKILQNITIIAMTSFLVCMYYSYKDPVFNFYQIFTRAWELLIGSCLALIELKYPSLKKTRYSNFLTLVGLLIILISFFIFNHNMLLPSWRTLLPLLGVILIINYSEDSNFAYKILSQKYVVAVGLISYALYLWHFPLLSFGLITDFSVDNNFRKLLILVVVVLMSVVSYFLVENPIRNRKKMSLKKVSVILIPIAIFLTSYQVYVAKKDGLPVGLPKDLHPLFVQESPWEVVKNDKGEPCHNQTTDLCIFNPNGNKKFLILGDSNTSSILPKLKKDLINKDYSVTVATGDWCYFLQDAKYLNKTNNEPHRFCEENFRSKVFSLILKQKFDYIIFGGRLAFYLDGKFDNEEGGLESVNLDMKILDENFQELSDNEITKRIEFLSKYSKLILIYPVPEVGTDVKNYLFNSGPKKKEKLIEYVKKNPISTSYEVFKRRQNRVFKIYDNIDSENLIKVFPHELFCSEETNRCKVTENGEIFFYDTHHLSQAGADRISELIIDSIK